MTEAEIKAKIEEDRYAALQRMEAKFARRISRDVRLSRLRMTRFLRHRPLNYKFERKK